ncbi:Fur family transcriptional regulator [Mycoplasma capricolum]|uniref:Fur family transcriptional regulator n=1 Tax=Mycoplasma capricolum TaxID=2095 RepID=UPI0022F39B6E|nr:transcriptional repressor [Mycoplasma capricolum]WBX36299.1 transcriptional repressor [Mycoplasma capricolum subsp. capricolum]
MIVLSKTQQQKYNQIVEKLKLKKIRLTDIRNIVIKMLIISDHLTIQEIINNLESEINNINVMSVYNTIDLLLKEHIVFANTFNGKDISYEIAADKSVHLKCDECLKVIHLDDKNIKNYHFLELLDLCEKYNIKLTHFKIEGHGYCLKCSNKEINK